MPASSTSPHSLRTRTRPHRACKNKFPTTDVFAHIEIADGRIWLLPDGIDCFAGDLPAEEQKLVWSTQGVPAADLFNEKIAGTAWRSKPSWYIVANNDRTVHPDLERFVWRTAWAQPTHESTAAMSRCSPTPTSCST